MSEQLPPIFSHVPVQQIASALRIFNRFSADFGTTLMEEGDVDPSLLCVVEGELEIRTGDVVLGTAGAGELVGEMALFGTGIRTATVLCTEPSTILVLDKAGFDKLSNDGNLVARAIEEVALRNLVERLRDTGERISSLAGGTPVEHVVPPAPFFQRVGELFGGGGVHKAHVDGVEALKLSPFFAGGTEGIYQALDHYMGAWSFNPGHFICTEGEFGDELYVLVEGLVDVLISTGTDKVEPVAVLEVGDVFGQVSMVQELPRMASCVARERAVVLVLERPAYQQIIGSNSPEGSLLRQALIRGLTDQLANANAQIALLDHEADRETVEDLAPLLRASAGVEAHGKHVTQAEPPARR